MVKKCMNPIDMSCPLIITWSNILLLIGSVYSGKRKGIPSILWPNWKLWKAHFKLWIIFWQSTSRVNSLKTHCPIFLWQLTNTQCTPMAWKAKLKWELNGVSSRTIHWIIIGNCHIWASYLNPTCVLEHFNFPLNSEQTL